MRLERTRKTRSCLRRPGRQWEALESRVLLSASTVAITTRYGNELVITGTGSKDAVDISQDGTTLTITANGQVYKNPAPLAGVFVYTRGGADSVIIESTVKVRTTVDAIDGSGTAVVSSASNVSLWMDSSDTETGVPAADLHSVASFAGGVSKAQGASLGDPKDSKQTVAVTNRSLFGAGPVPNDVNQGSVGDCWFMAGMAAIANQKPGTLQESAVDMGDGTYTVEFYRNGAPTFVRVSNDFTTGPFNGFRFASPGANNTIWAMVMEKALCYFRSGKNTYNSISGGEGNEAFSYFNINSTVTAPSTYSEASLYSAISHDLANGQAVVFGTRTNTPDLVGNHEYTIIGCSIDPGTGATQYVVRNPWGVAGDSLENPLGYATITFAQLTANASDITQALA